jgi:uncharacterized membrane protein (DUF106 family)
MMRLTATTDLAPCWSMNRTAASVSSGSVLASAVRQIDQAAVVDHKRLGHTLQMAQVIQAQRDDRRASGSPSRTNQGEAPRPRERKVGTRKQRELTREQLNEAIRGTPGMRVGSVLESPLT